MSDLKPYVVFVAPPNLEKLKHIRVKQGAKVTVRTDAGATYHSHATSL